MREHDPAVKLPFYDRVRPIVDRTLTRLLGASDPDYEDVAQIALFELVLAVPGFRGECPLDAWISIVAARAAYGQIRKRKRERRLFVGVALEDLAPERRGPGPSLASRQAVARVRAHLSQMEQGRAWAYLLHDVYGYDLAEISQITGASLSASQSRLVRGRRDIHERIRKDPELARFLDDLDEEVP
jgi:RNA polymerase sigma-70 factor (ECF subfamily)